MHFYRASFSQDKIRRIVSDMEHKSWKRKNNTGVPEEVIHHPGAGVEVPLLHFPLLEKTGIVKEGFTTRLGGVSEGIFSTMNLSFTRGDEEEAVGKITEDLHQRLMWIMINLFLRIRHIRQM